MSNTDTLVSRRLVSLVTEGLPGDVPEDAIKRHHKHAALFHKGLSELCRADLTRVDMELFAQVLQGGRIPVSLRAKAFKRGVLEAVKSHGGQFANARMTTIPGAETFESQRDRNVIKFWTDWHFKPEEAERLFINPSIASQVVYLEDVVEGSLDCSFDKVEEGRKSVEEVLASLPKVEGLRWRVGNAPTVNRVLANHLEGEKVYLLPNRYTWTTDEYEYPDGSRRRLLVGSFRSGKVGVSDLRPGCSHGDVGLFVLGVPE